jgi:hypothetical protein
MRLAQRDRGAILNAAKIQPWGMPLRAESRFDSMSVAEHVQPANHEDLGHIRLYTIVAQGEASYVRSVPTVGLHPW